MGFFNEFKKFSGIASEVDFLNSVLLGTAF